jgi:hypothetical protein
MLDQAVRLSPGRFTTGAPVIVAKLRLDAAKIAARQFLRTGKTVPFTEGLLQSATTAHTLDLSGESYRESFSEMLVETLLSEPVTELWWVAMTELGENDGRFQHPTSTVRKPSETE